MSADPIPFPAPSLISQARLEAHDKAAAVIMLLAQAEAAARAMAEDEGAVLLVAGLPDLFSRTAEDIRIRVNTLRGLMARATRPDETDNAAKLAAYEAERRRYRLDNPHVTREDLEREC